MRLRHTLGLSAAVVTAVVGTPLPAVAAEPVPVLYVDNGWQQPCDDHGPGSAAKPFCTVQAAADVVQPGQTVQIAAATEYFEDLRITRSGEPGKPITFRGGAFTGMSSYSLPSLFPSSHTPVRLKGVHDVVLDGLGLAAVDIADSARVEVTGSWIESPTSAQRPPAPGVAVSGQSDQVTVSRSVVYLGQGVRIGAGAKRTTIAGNQFGWSSGTAVQATDAPGTTVVNNTLVNGITSGIALDGTSPNATVVNNVVSKSTVSVSAESAYGTRLDHNVVDPVDGLPAYSWAGTGYRTAAELQAATGRGAYDVNTAVAFDPSYLPLAVPTAASTAVIDSADATVSGLRETDLVGQGAIDHPSVANTGLGSGFRDRGAYELAGLREARLEVLGTVHEAPQGPAPLTVRLNAHANNSWDTKLSYTFDFGDGTAPVTTTESSVQHTYTAVGEFRPSLTVTDGRGGKVTDRPSQPVVAGEDKPLSATLAVTPDGSRNPLEAVADLTTAGPYRIAGYTFDFGDGTPVQPNEGFHIERHVYARPGTYTVTATAVDDSGAKVTSTRQVTVDYTPAGFTALAPTRVLDTRTQQWGGARLGGGDAVELDVRYPRVGGNLVPAGATAVVLNLTATGGDRSSFLSAYPSGSAVPGTSNVNYAAGQDVANLVTVPIGPDGRITIRNANGNVHAVADVLGYFKPDAAAKFTSLTPARLLDTRTGDPVPAYGTRRLKVAGAGGVPAGATSVVLNVTATESTAAGFFTVYPAGTQRPATGSNLNTAPGRNIPNQVVVPLGADGSVDLYNHNGSSHAVVDVFGYYSPEGKGLFTPVTPTRISDSRTAGAYGPGTVRTVTGVPAGATAAAINLTATQTTEATHLTAWATGTPRPGTSNLNATPGLDVPNHTTIPVDAAGRFDIANNSGTTHVIADLFGYYRNQ